MSLFRQVRDAQFTPPDRKEWWGLARWLALFALLYSLLSLGYAWLIPSYSWEFPAKLITISGLAWFAARRGQHALMIGLCGALYLLNDFPLYGTYFLGTCALCYGLLHYGGRFATPGFWTALVLLAIVVPKGLFLGFYHQPARWQWWQEAASIGLFFRYAYYFYEWRRGLWEQPDFLKHLAYLAFIPQIFANLYFSPSAQWQASPAYPAAVKNGVRLLGLAFLKIACWHLLDRLGPDGPGTGAAGAWIFVLTSYVMWFCWLSAQFDLAIVFCRFLGADIPDNFRYPLLAASPIEHWRRWNIFNRTLLLKFFYFPFGGGQHHAYRNVLIVFLASALVLHTGWFGSVYPTFNGVFALHWVGYALINAALVIANMEWRRRRGLDRHHRPSGWRWLVGWAGTQAVMAWAHLFLLWHPYTLMPGDTAMDAAARLRLLLQGLGLD